jgi:hypothetical protein
MAKRNRLFHWQVFTVLLMLFGYSSYYLCRSNFWVALPLGSHAEADDRRSSRFRGNHSGARELHPAVQFPPCRSNFSFLVNLTARTLGAVADRLLVEHPVQCNTYVR